MWLVTKNVQRSLKSVSYLFFLRHWYESQIPSSPVDTLEIREGSNEEEEEDDYEEDNIENSDKKMGVSPNGLQIHITSDSVDLEESRIAP